MIIITGGLIETEQGHVYWDYIDDEGGYIEIYDLYVKPEFRNKGYAHTLLTCAKILIEKQYPYMIIKITPAPNEKDIDIIKLTNFYISLGLFVHYPLPDNEDQLRSLLWI